MQGCSTGGSRRAGRDHPEVPDEGPDNQALPLHARTPPYVRHAVARYDEDALTYTDFAESSACTFPRARLDRTIDVVSCAHESHERVRGLDGKLPPNRSTPIQHPFNGILTSFSAI